MRRQERKGIELDTESFTMHRNTFLAISSAPACWIFRTWISTKMIPGVQMDSMDSIVQKQIFQWPIIIQRMWQDLDLRNIWKYDVHTKSPHFQYC